MEETLEKYAEILAEARDQDNLIETTGYMAKKDLFFLLVFMCGRKDMLRPWLFRRCQEVQSSPDGHIDLWAR